MRRWLAILLLLMLPLQFSWAAVAVYCAHESDAQVQHLGHHEHQHAGQTVVDDKGAEPSSSDGPPTLDLDCGHHCHASCFSLLEDPGTLTVLALASRLGHPADGNVRTLAQEPPERPQWLRFA